MPGAFAHLTLTNLASGDIYLDEINLHDNAYIAIKDYLNYCELGSVSPDYPYLVIPPQSKHTNWADYMHIDEKTKSFILSGINSIKNLDNQVDKEKSFAWLCGVVSHIVADVVIHPVVELKVGPYDDNKTEHRICESHQDAYIYQRLNLGAVGLAEHLKSGVEKCSAVDDKDKLNPIIKQIWEDMLKAIRPNEFESNKPDIDTWHKAFNQNVSIFEEGGKLHPLARHVAVNTLGATYPAEDKIDEQYIKNLHEPSGTLMDYDEIFDKAIDQVLQSWKILGEAVFNDDNEYLSYFGDWNLDSGRNNQSALVFWA